MNDSGFTSADKPSLLERLSALLTPEPEDRGELVALLRAAHERELLGADILAIVEGALQISDMRVRDIMVPRSQMDVLRIDDSMETIAAFAVKTAHSRFPVVCDGKDNVVGILLAKDLLRYFAGHEFNLRATLRPAVFIPESKPLDVLLREFRLSHNHMAIVVDEYGGVAGLVTIEDVLEQIVGEIEDEYDADDDDDILPDHAGHYRVKATTTIGDFNEAFATAFSDEDADTIGGFLICHLGRLPRRDEAITMGSLRFRVLRADGRRIYTLLVDRLPASPEAEAGAASA
ncbi:MAG: CBS domain-containing protein [Azoarcus sp.]|jgi:magnesium and cobalt transporter|nr:CBS domain-containing protein [Azoarcus sp.]